MYDQLLPVSLDRTPNSTMYDAQQDVQVIGVSPGDTPYFKFIAP